MAHNHRWLAAASLGLGLLLVTGYAAYKGHADDRDVEAVLAAYPQLKGGASDSCAPCHRSGRVEEGSGSRVENHCGYCHAVHVRGGRPAVATLTRFGAEYLAAGRGVAALRKIAGGDADGDGVSNEAELLAGTLPGEASSRPGAALAPHRVYSGRELRALSPVVGHTVFLNTSHNRQGDFYNQYRGNSVYALLEAIGLAPGAESVDFISVDGFEGTFTLEELRREWAQARPVPGLDKKALGACGWVNYNAAGLDPGRALPSMKVMLAFEENGRKIEPAHLDPASGRIVGTGPLRLVVPQFVPSPPDLPKNAGAECQKSVAPEYAFNEEYDHNGGRSSFSIIAVRVRPLPEGTRDFEWEKERDALLAGEKIVFFGALQ
ncbi:MAG: hypothetical protein GXY47_05920 [Acidobacteria bacterium]|nr:hypothetical protein [Acidobacteriota bacterium]